MSASVRLFCDRGNNVNWSVGECLLNLPYCDKTKPAPDLWFTCDTLDRDRAGQPANTVTLYRDGPTPQKIAEVNVLYSYFGVWGENPPDPDDDNYEETKPRVHLTRFEFKDAYLMPCRDFVWLSVRDPLLPIYYGLHMDEVWPDQGYEHELGLARGPWWECGEPDQITQYQNCQLYRPCVMQLPDGAEAEP